MRQWRAFDRKTINDDLDRLNHEDFLRLAAAMKAYRLDGQAGYVVKRYGSGLMMLKDYARDSGACLFFTVRKLPDRELLTAMLVGGKGIEEDPRRAFALVKARMV